VDEAVLFGSAGIVDEAVLFGFIGNVTNRPGSKSQVQKCLHQQFPQPNFNGMTRAHPGGTIILILICDSIPKNLRSFTIPILKDCFVAHYIYP
jgi:hypothetical protein